MSALAPKADMCSAAAIVDLKENDGCEEATSSVTPDRN
jgi:hypothetical protein